MTAPPVAPEAADVIETIQALLGAVLTDQQTGRGLYPPGAGKQLATTIYERIAPAIREQERADADLRSMGGMGIAVAVERAVRRLGITPREPHKRALRWLYQAGVAAGVDIWKRSGDLEPEQVTAIRAAERERIRQLAIQRTATYRTTDDADPSPFAEEFADLLGGDS